MNKAKVMKSTKAILLTASILLMTMTTITPVYALDSDLTYSFHNSEAGNFGKATSIDQVTVMEATNTYNINVSKDSAFIPPAFGSYSADTKGTGELLTPNISGISQMSIGSGSISAVTNAAVGGGTVVYPPSSGVSSPNYSYTDHKFTLPDGLYYSDGSIGRLKIDEIDLSVKVYETESLESLAKGAGHFKFTSCWDGNIGLCGHNRGVTNHFGKIHTLEKGDKIKYTTKLGTRAYKVVSVKKIEETDFSYLQRASDNRITLITCVNNQPTKRWCVQAIEV